MNNFFLNGIFLFNLNLTFLALLGAIMAIIPSFSSLNRKSIQIKSIFPFWLGILIMVSINLCFLYLSPTYLQQFLGSQSFQIQKFTVLSFETFNFLTLVCFILFISFIPYLIDPIRILENICAKLPKSFPKLKVELRKKWEIQSSYNLNFETKRSITIINIIRRNRELQEILGLYIDIIIHGDYTQQRRASEVLIERFKKSYKPEHDDLFNELIIPILFYYISHTLHYDFNWSFYVKIIDEICFLLQYISKNRKGITFENGSHLLRNIYREIFLKYKNKTIESTNIDHILQPYFECIRIECEDYYYGVIYFADMIDLLGEINNAFGCEHFTMAMYRIDNFVRDLLLKSIDINSTGLLLNKLRYLFSQSKIASCQFNENSPLTLLLIGMRRIQDELIKKGDEISINKCTLIAAFIKQQIGVNRRHIAIARSPESMEDIMNGYSNNKCKGKSES